MTDLDRLTTALADRYSIERELGHGGMATVYLAHDVKHDRHVALKVLRPELAAVIGGDRFLQEIKTTANLHHAHILPLHDSGEADGLVYYVMPYIEGESLRDRIDRDTQLPVEEAVRIAREVADALDYAHRQGVIHRDIKPDNIMLHDGHVVVADFGIALAASRSDDGTRMTETGMSLGTPHYMSPEQAMGDREIRASSDVYALACVLYEMLMGEPPFTGPTAQAIVAKVMTDDPAGLAIHRKSIPPHVESAVLVGLEKLPADRFATAAEFSEALAGATTARTTASFAPPPVRSGPWPHVAIVASILAVAALAFGMWALRQQPALPTVRLSVAFPPGERIRSLGTRRFDLAPDGSRMVYIGPDSGGGDQLWVRDMNSLTARPLSGTGGSLAPFFSPDGESVAYFTGNPGDLRVLPLNGGPAHTVVRDSSVPWGGDWDKTGTIYFGNLRGELARVSSSGGTVEVVSHRDTASGVAEHDWPEILPGGKKALVQIWYNSISDTKIGVVDLATGKATPIIDGVYGRYIPTGHIVYVTVNGSLLSVPFDPSSATLTGQPRVIVEQIHIDATAGSAQFSIADNGLLAYVPGSGQGSAQVVWVDRTGAQTALDSTWRGRFSGVALSPDGSQLAVAVLGNDGEHVWVKRLPGGPLSRLTLGGYASRPAWTMDGRRVGFISTPPGGGRRQARVQRADGSAEAEPIAVDTRSVEELAWTPDGGRYLYRTGINTNSRDIHIAALGDSGWQTLVSGQADEFAPAVSPDGEWFAYVSNEAGRSEVFVRLLDDPEAGRTQISVNGGTEPRWDPSGKELFYRTRRGEMMAVEVTLGSTFSAGPPQVLFVAPNLRGDEFHHAYDVSRDGRFLMINEAVGNNSELVMVFNWFDELRKHE